MPDPKDFGDDESSFMEECISTARSEGKDQDEAVAMCSSMWREKAIKNKCVIHKTHASDGDGLDFVLSDASADRYGDVIEADGWHLENFKRNPIALFNHNNDFPVGKWENLHVSNGALRGTLRPAPKGTSARIDEIRALIDAGILRATSVGFLPIESEPISKGLPGNRYKRQELVECSVVSVPANANALAIAKGLKVSDDTMKLVFAKHGDKNTGRKRVVVNGKNAEAPRKNRTSVMSPLTQRIDDAQKRIVSLKDKLGEHLKDIDDENPKDEDIALTEELTSQIETQEKALDGLKKAETKLASAAVKDAEDNGSGGQGGQSNLVVRNSRPFAVPAKKVKAGDYIWRALACEFRCAVLKGRKSYLDVLKEAYGEDEPTRVMAAHILTRTATTPATTTTVGWAADLVQTGMAEFMESLFPISVYPQLRAKGGTFTFGQNGIVTIPYREATPVVSGAFVAEGAPIPVKQAAFNSLSFTPKKMGVITTMTAEAAQYTVPGLEGVLRQAVLDDTAVVLDSTLLDTSAATAIRPAGLLNGVTLTGASAASTNLDKFVADATNLIGQLITSSYGNLRAPVWLMGKGDVIKAQALPTTTGDLPFREEIAGGTLFGIPIIQSTAVASAASDTMVLMDAADFVTATGDTPSFDVSDQAVLHFDDTTPLDITTGSVGTTVKSMWQSNMLAVRMLLPINWGMRRASMVKGINTLGWN